jgi:hypothetical protein
MCFNDLIQDLKVARGLIQVLRYPYSLYWSYRTFPELVHGVFLILGFIFVLFLPFLSIFFFFLLLAVSV